MVTADDLSRISWGQLQHAYGPAEDTPRHLLALLSSREDERRHALGELWASICHQGSVYEASCAAIPFLIQILEQVPPDQKPPILGLLAGLAHRDWYANREQTYLHIDHSLELPLRNQQKPWNVGQFLADGNEFHESLWMEQAHKLVGDGLQTFLDLLHTDNAPTLASTLYLLSAFKEHHETLVPNVAGVYETLSDPILKSACLFCLGPLLEATCPVWDELFTPAVSAPDSAPILRLAASLSEIQYRRRTLPPECVTVLIQAMVSPRSLDETYEMLPWAEEPVHVVSCQTLAHLGGDMGLDALVRALKQGAAGWRIVDTVRVAEALLDVAFFGDLVHDRYWSFLLDERITFEDAMAEIVEGDRHPYDQRSYYNYGRSYPSPRYREEFEITCFGYDEQETARLAEAFERQGSNALAARQREALCAVLACDELWSVRSELLNIYGLPADRAALAKFLEAKESTGSDTGSS